jgi:hypothetical protein
MVKEIVVKDSLSREMIVAGAELTRRLDEAHLVVDAALWQYDPENNFWRFIVASPDVKAQGPKKVYKKVQSVISKMEGDQDGISLKDITVFDSKDAFIQLLRSGLRTVDEISHIRVIQGVIKGVPIGDAYIYRLK